jgi:DNA-binding winged helix-turn-helix (wHTH) protein
VILRFGDCELDVERYALRRRGREVEVQPRVLDVLIHLARASGRVVARSELHQQVWQGVFVSDAALSYAIKEARRAIGDDGTRQALIQTVRSRGFRLVTPVSQGTDATLDAAPDCADPFVGRHEVMTALEAELEAARQGAGRFVLLEGEPGIGKSRTLRELAALARARGFRVLVGRGVEGVDAPDYWPWTQALRELLDAPGRSPIPGDAAGVIAQMMPALRELLPEAAGQPSRRYRGVHEARFHLFDAVARTWAALARETPLLLALDDLQRADAGSLSLLGFVVRELDRVPALLFATSRSAPFVADPERARQLGELLREPRARSLRLGGLDRAEVAALVGALRGEAPPEAEVDEFLRRTRGNPFFVREILMLGWASASAGELPVSVREAVLRHLDALPESCRALLHRAAVLGQRFELDVLAALDGLEPERVDAELDAAVAARVVELAEPAAAAYQFVHALIREALAASLPASELRLLHARAARALETCEPAPAHAALRGAQHLVQAVPAISPRAAVAACRRAAAHARARLAHDEVVALLEQASGLLATEAGDADHLELLFELADAQLVAARIAAARATCTRAAELARRASDRGALARAALGFAGEQDDARTDAQIVTVLEEAAAALGPGDATLRARLQSRLAEAIYHRPELERAAALSRDAVAMARRCGDPLTLGHVLKARHWSAWAPDNLEEREAIAAELLELAGATGSPELVDEALGFGISNALERGDGARVALHCDDYARLAARSGRLFFDWHLAHYRVMQQLLAGDADAAEAGLQRAARLGQQTGYEVASTWFGVQLYGLRSQQGRLAELAPVMRQLAARYPLSPWRLSLACEDVRDGKRDEGVAALRDCGADGLRAPRRDLSYLTTLWFLADLCAQLGATREARLVECALEPFADRHVVVGIGMLYLGPVARALGAVAQAQGRERDAQRRFEDARARDLCAPRVALAS